MVNFMSLRIITSLSSVFLPVAALAGPITFVPTDLAPGDTYHLTFVTSTTRDATSSSIADYDAFVQAAADTAGGGLENITWLAIGTAFGGNAAINHSPVSGPVYRLDNTRIANDQNDLWDGSILATISITEFGNSLSTDVWTGTKDDGQGDARSNSHELGTTDKPNVSFGDSGASDSGWISQGLNARNDQTDLFSVYGISEALAVSLGTPDTISAIYLATTTTGRLVASTIKNRLASLRAGNEVVTGGAAGDGYRGVSAWWQGFGATTDQDNRGGVAGYDADTLGTTLGMDALFGDRLRVGAAFSFSDSDVETEGTGIKIDFDSYQGTVYGSYDNAPYFVNASFSSTFNHYDSRRNTIVGALSQVASADFDGHQFVVSGDVGREFALSEDAYLTPQIGLFYMSLDVDGFTETGAGVGNLTVASNTTDALESSLGVSLRREIERGGIRMVPEAHVAWRHEFLDDAPNSTSTFTGGGGSFSSQGLDEADDSVNLGASLLIRSNEQLEFWVSYDFEVKSGYDSHSAALVVQYKF